MKFRTQFSSRSIRGRKLGRRKLRKRRLSIRGMGTGQALIPGHSRTPLSLTSGERLCPPGDWNVHASAGYPGNAPYAGPQVDAPHPAMLLPPLDWEISGLLLCQTRKSRARVLRRESVNWFVEQLTSQICESLSHRYIYCSNCRISRSDPSYANEGTHITNLQITQAPTEMTPGS